MSDLVAELVEEFKERLTLDGRKRVFEDGRELRTEDMETGAKPEAVTLQFIIDEILADNDMARLSEKSFDGIRGNTVWADYQVETSDGRKMVLEAKPLNQDLDADRSNAALNQVKGLFRLADVKDEYEFGIATDGLRWIIVDREARVVYDLDAREDYDRLKRILGGDEPVSAGKIEQEISKRFYDQYDALLHGGKYADADGHRRSISEDDCLVENVRFVPDKDAREQVAQTVMDRLIFLRFLQSKGVIDFDLLDYLSGLDEDVLNAKLKQLFFRVMNLPQDKRADIDERFADIPYLNGSLFVKTGVEREHDYQVGAEILQEVIDFLDSFSFVHREAASDHEVLDPEILGYIFERAMTAAEQKDTGAYYTPRNVTEYICEHTIHPAIIDRVNDTLREKGYKESELIDDLEDVFILNETTLADVFSDLAEDFTVCDNACGSGAFLLAAAESLLGVYRRMTEELRLGHSDIALRKIILKNNLYGVDINPNAIEIAKLRLWLWLVDAYDPDSVQPLPNIDYNIRTGNSLVGYVHLPDLSEDDPERIGHYTAEENVTENLVERAELVAEYKGTDGDEARKIRRDLNELDADLEHWLDVSFSQMLYRKTDLDKDVVQELRPFHWGHEFYDVFEDGGFDVIIGNPPYVRQESLTGMKDYLDALYDVYHGRADLYQYFFQRSFETLKDGGYFAYIVSNKWLRTGYGEPLRAYLSQYRVEEFIDFGDTEVFKGVAAYPCITVMQKRDEPNDDIRTAQVDTEEFAPLDAFMDQHAYTSSQAALDDTAWKFLQLEVLELMQRLQAQSTPLQEVVEDTYRGILTGLNDAFIIDEETRRSLLNQDSNSSDLIKPFITGGNIRRYYLEEQGEYVILIPSGWTNEHFAEEPSEEEAWSWFSEVYPAIADYLENYEERARERYDQGEFWWELRSCNYYERFEEPKLLYGIVVTGPRFAFDIGDFYFNDTGYMIPGENKQLLGILNSKLGWFMISKICTEIQRGYKLNWKYFGNIPVVNDSSELLEELVDRMLELQERKQDGADVDDDIAEVDEKIDQEVYDLYGLSDEEIEIVESAV